MASRQNSARHPLRRGAGAKFEFDAPQFEDFTQPQYWLQKQLLEQAVLPAEQRVAWSVEDLSLAAAAAAAPPLPSPNASLGGGGGDGGGEDWFQRVHHEHEPTSPPTPAGPLISPSPLRPRAFCTSTPPPAKHAASPLHRLYRQSQGQSYTQHHSDHSPSPHQSLVSTPLRGNFGLRAKPGRVLHAVHAAQAQGQGEAAAHSAARLPLPQIKTPTSRRVSFSLSPASPAGWRVAPLGRLPRRSSSIEGAGSFRDTGTDTGTGTDTSLPSVADWSSIPETPPLSISGAAGRDSAGGRASKRTRVHLPPSPCPHAASPVGHEDRAQARGRRLGTALRAVRVPPAAETGDAAAAAASAPLARDATAASPILKRVKVDAKFCPAPVAKVSSARPRVTAAVKDGLAGKGVDGREAAAGSRPARQAGQARGSQEAPLRAQPEAPSARRRHEETLTRH